MVEEKEECATYSIVRGALFLFALAVLGLAFGAWRFELGALDLEL